MNNNFITFTIPFYENEDLLQKAITSLLAQSSIYWRLIISLDSPLSVTFDTFLHSLSDNRIQIIQNVNPGICSNWNNCINAVESKFITILHSDDELKPYYVETVLSLINKEPENALYFCGAQVIDINSQPIFSFVDKVKSIIQPNTLKLSGELGLTS